MAGLGEFNWRQLVPDSAWILGAALPLTLLIAAGPPVLAVAAVAGSIAFAIVFALPELGLLLTVAAIPLEDAGTIAQIAGIKLSISKLMGALTALVWFIHLLLGRGKLWLPKPVMLLGLYILAGVFSLLDAKAPWDGVIMTVRLLTTLLFFIMVINLVDSWEKFYRALCLLLLSGVLVQFYTLAQQIFPGALLEHSANQDLFANEAQPLYGVLKDEVETASIGHSVLRSSGTTWHPMVSVLYPVLLVPPLAFFAFHSKSRWFRVAASIGVLAAMGGMVASGSRSSVIALVVALFLLVKNRVIPINRFLITAVIFASVIGWFALPEDFKARVFNPSAYNVETGGSLSGRIEMFNAGIQVFAKSPFNGVGLANLSEMSNYLKNWDFGEHGMGVHNMYLQVALETGIIGLTAVMAMFLYLLKGFYSTSRQFASAGRGDDALLARSLAICVWVVLVTGLMLDIMHLSMKNAWFLFALQPILMRLSLDPTFESMSLGSDYSR